jgi:DNA replication protein DnaC
MARRQIITTETEDSMQALANTLTVIRGKLHPEEQAAVTQFTIPGSNPACQIRGDTGWRRAENAEFAGLKRCECVKAKSIAALLAQIPERFRDSTFESYRPKNLKQEQAIALMRKNSANSFYLTGSYGSGKTHLLYAQYREKVLAGTIRCHVRRTRELIEELRRSEFDCDFVSPVPAAASKPEPYHLFWDDIDKLKPTDFKTEVLFELVDSLYGRNHGLTVTSNYSLRDLIKHERLHPAIVRRLDDICRVVEL